MFSSSEVGLPSSSSVPGEKGLSVCSYTEPQRVLPGIASRLGIFKQEQAPFFSSDGQVVLLWLAMV